MTSPPSAALVVFHGHGHGLLTRLLEPGFRHCFVCLRDARGYWIRVDGRAGIPELLVEAPAGFDLAAHYRRRGFAVVECSDLGTRAPRIPVMAATCVGVAKRLIGLRAPFVFTPRALWKRLGGANNRNKESRMDATCKPHMLSEYPLGYSRLSYETEDPITAVEAAGYFGPAAPVLRVRDVIEVWADIAGERPVLRTYAVTRADAAGMVVDISPVEELASQPVRRPLRRGKSARPVAAAEG